MTITRLNLRPELEQPLQEMANRLQKNPEWIINQALASFLITDSQEEALWQETLPALDDVEAGRIVPAEKVEAWIDSWNTNNELPKPRA